MDPFTELKQQVADYLGERLEQIQVTTEYPAVWGRLPCKQPRVAVDIDRLELPNGDGQAQITLRFDILCPVGYPGGCQTIFEQLCTALLRARGQFGVCAVGCGEVEYRREWDMLLLCAKTTLHGMIGWSEDDSGVPLTQVLLKQKRSVEDEQIAK